MALESPEITADLADSVRDQALDAAVQDLQEISTADGESVLEKIDQQVGNMKVQESFVTDAKNVDTINVYSTVDGTASSVLVSMLSKILRRRVPADPNIPDKHHGKRAFALTVPKNLPVRLRLLCWLHPEHAMREELDQLGMTTAICRKSNLPSEFEAQMHVQTKHKRSWAAIEANRAASVQKQGLESQSAQAEAMVTLASQLQGLLTETVQNRPAPEKAAPPPQSSRKSSPSSGGGLLAGD
jgi:hypothetical protein